MVLGGLVYDANLLHRAAGFVGLDVSFNPKVTMRFPVYLTLINAVCALVVTLRMKEPPREIKNAGPASVAGSFAFCVVRSRFSCSRPACCTTRSSASS